MNWLDYLTLAFCAGALVFNVLAMAEIRKRHKR